MIIIPDHSNVAGMNAVGVGPSKNESSNANGVDIKQLDQLLALIIAMMLQKQNGQKGQDSNGSNGNTGVNQQQAAKGVGQDDNSAGEKGNSNDLTQILMQIVMQLVMQSLQNQSGQQGAGSNLSNFGGSV